MTENGDLYESTVRYGRFTEPPTLIGNFWAGATPAPTDSWGSIKVRYRR